VIASPARGPLTRTTAIAAGGRPEDKAKMVGRSRCVIVSSSRRLISQKPPTGVRGRIAVLSSA
jgi:hypothetical protein